MELRDDPALLPVEDSLDELTRLADTAGIDVVGQAIQRIDKPNSATYIGSGKVEEVKLLVDELQVDVVIVDDELSPRHQREALEEAFGEEVKVVDRTALILDIFGQHPNARRTASGGAGAIGISITRLTRMWTHLARQAEAARAEPRAASALRGPGETQLETDRREINRRIAHQDELDAVRAHRERHRAKRQQTELQVVAIVGYTNAGKSTLLNKLSGADVLTADMLFATLGPDHAQGQYARRP